MTVRGFTLNDGTTNTGATSMTGTVPAGVAAGDVLVVVSSQNTGTATNTISGGGTGVTWTPRSGPDDNGTVAQTYVWTATAVSNSAGSTVTVSTSASGRLVGTGAGVSGVTETGIVVNLTKQTSATTSMPFPSVTIPDSHGWTLLGLAVMRIATTTAVTLTAPSGCTKDAEARTAYSTFAEFTATLVHKTATVGSGSQSPGTGTASASVNNSMLYTVGLAPNPISGTVALSGTGSLGLSGLVTAGAGTLALSGTGTLGLSPVVTAGAGTLNLSGTGTLTVFGHTIPLPAIVSPSARWSWAMGAWQGLPTMALANALRRSMKLRLTGTSSATFDLDGSTAEAAAAQELISDVWCIRNGFTLFRGRLGPTSESTDATTSTVSYTAGDYRAVLQRRLLFDSDTLTYTSVEQAAIAWGLVSSTQAQGGGDLGLVDGTTPTGVARTITYPAGQSIGQAIEQLSLMDSGFNWDVVPTTGQTGQAFTVWTSRGDSRQRVVDFPGCVAKYQRAVDPGSYANAIRETGDTGIAAVTLAASDVSLRAEGRWDAQVGDTSLKDATSVTARANYDLAQSQQVVPAYTVTLQAGAWGGPPDIWLGDEVLLVIDTPLRQVADNLRVFEIDIDLDDADNETVTLTLSALDPFKRARARQYDYRLTQLERR